MKLPVKGPRKLSTVTYNNRENQNLQSLTELEGNFSNYKADMSGLKQGRMYQETAQVRMQWHHCKKRSML